MKSSKEIIQEIKRIRKEKKISLDKMSEMVGASKSTLSRYESGAREFPINDIGKYAKALGTTVGHLLGVENIEEVTKDNLVEVPILGRIACGDPIIAEENIVGYRAMLKDSLPSGESFLLQTAGNSMEPTIPEGSEVLVRYQNDVENGEIAAVLVNGDTEATLKRVKKLKDRTLLMPDNNDYDPIIIDEENPARILGKAVNFTHTL